MLTIDNPAPDFAPPPWLAVLGIGAIEQHSHHLPVATDWTAVMEISRRVAQELDAWLLPALPFSMSECHGPMDGTVWIKPATLAAVLRDVARSLRSQGVRRLLLLNGHGGNIVPLQQALFELKQDRRTPRDLMLLSLTYWDAAGSPEGKIAGLVQKQMGHACEWETSMVLRLNPNLVAGPVKDVPEVPQGHGFAPGYRAWVMPDRSEPGHIGHPSSATAEKGEALFAHFATGVAAYLDRVAGAVGVWE